MKNFLFFTFSLIYCVAALPVEELLLTGEDVQVLGRALSLADYNILGVDTNDVSPLIIEDGLLKVPELLKKYGYPVEIHSVQTPDGYLLEMHRIPKPGAMPVLLVHGLMDSSGGWVIAGPHSALAYYLSDLGYDVWMANCRGNTYSTKHTYLDVNGKDYWDFSFHEIGEIDLPAMIDHVLKNTKSEKIHYIGHSQGTTTFFVMCHLRPDYCGKIRTMNALAPVAYLRHVKSPFVVALSKIVDQLEFLTKLLGITKFHPNNAIFKLAGQVACKKEAVTQILCNNILFLIAGYNSQELNKTMVPAILGHIPAGASSKQMVHFGQLAGRKHFRMFDYGWLKNWSKYGSLSPPSYDLKKVTAPVALYYGGNDWLGDRIDSLQIKRELPNLIFKYENDEYNHLDFLAGIHSREYVYKKVVKVMQDFDSNNN